MRANAATKRWRENRSYEQKLQDVQVNRRRNLWASYRITPEEYARLVDQQDSRCLICQVPFSGNAKPHIDHDHKNGTVRGVLCHLCNVLIGHARESDWILQQARYYLENS